MRFLFPIAVFLSCFLFKATFVFGAEPSDDEVVVEDAVPQEALKRRADAPESSASAKVVSRSYRGSSSSLTQVTLSPVLGTNIWAGGWNKNIDNHFHTGVLLDVPVNAHWSVESEVDYGRYDIAYGYIRHGFNKFDFGMSGKYYFGSSEVFRPYAGGGLLALYYQGMQRLPGDGFDQWIGASQLFVGTDVKISDGLWLGARAAWINPLFNRPYTADNGVMSLPGFEDAGAINSQYYRFVGSVKIAL